MLVLHERSLLRPLNVPLVFQLCMTPADACLMAGKLCKEQMWLGSHRIITCLMVDWAATVLTI